ncbi:MAG: restriction endonuclease subunit S [Candidatus Omnitrophica bacterium]|nr:restriction endonuclease subunit S [Candidatus Omnitrophota bacterium]
MAVWSEVKISDIQYTRIDSEFYKPHYLWEDSVWKSFSQKYDVKRLSKMISEPVRTGRTPRNRRITKNDSTVHFIKTNTLREGRIDYDNCDFIPEYALSPKDYINDDSVVVTIIGATHEIVGRAAIIRSVDPKRVTNQNVAIIKTSNSLNPYYLTAYLQIKMGRDQLWRHSRQTEQVNLNCREVERILIPSPPISLQDKIGSLIQKSFALLDSSKSLYAQAQELLESELELDKLVFDKPLSYEARLSEVVGNNRADADYYQIAFRQIESHLTSIQTIPLSKIATFSKGIEVGSGKYTDSGKLFARVSNMKEMGIITGSSDKYISDSLFKSLAAFKPAVGELLLTKDGTPGVCYCLDTLLDGIISSGIVRLSIIDPSISPEYLALAINSKACRMQIERECSGALIVHWKLGSIKKLKIPLLSKSKRDKLADLVIQSKQALRESQNLLETAKRHVEDLIEEAVQK